MGKFNPYAGVQLLQSFINDIRIPEVDVSRRWHTADVWNQLIVLSDCLEILSGRGAAVPNGLSDFFQYAAMQAIDQEIAFKERYMLAISLGRLSDPRITLDLRVRAHPDEHPGYVKIPAGSYYYGDGRRPLPFLNPSGCHGTQ